jgi:type VI protein secretion system component VasK
MVSDSFTLSAIELAANKDGKPTSLGEIMKQVISKFKVKIEASANQRTRQTTFNMKSESQKELDKAKRSLIALLSPMVRLRAALSEFPWNVVLGHYYPACSCLYHPGHHRIQRLVSVC